MGVEYIQKKEHFLKSFFNGPAPKSKIPEMGQPISGIPEVGQPKLRIQEMDQPKSGIPEMVLLENSRFGLALEKMPFGGMFVTTMTRFLASNTHSFR